ncbi:hypothetical protein E2C01_024785 [Portunus trituberculatus]|uniref:Uncharacterized protein n=1 Tax=Portunus trituberculatus TaxID=210409 RepID=A0A5B7EDR1_PORTR|nr:hypothetical protein [Portunus trituberculatus]
MPTLEPFCPTLRVTAIKLSLAHSSRRAAEVRKPSIHYLLPSPELTKFPNLFEPGSGVQPKAVQDQSICKYKKQSPATFYSY